MAFKNQYKTNTQHVNIYRLYCDKTYNGKKIPYLNKSTILKYVKTIGKTNTIAIVINNDINLALFEIKKLLKL